MNHEDPEMRAAAHTSAAQSAFELRFPSLAGTGRADASSLKAAIQLALELGPGGVNVNASAWGRDKSSGAFSTAYLGRYTLGLGHRR